MSAAIGDLVRERREAAGLTRQDLARRAGLSLSGVQLVEDGQRPEPRFTTVVRLARALGTSVDSFSPVGNA